MVDYTQLAIPDRPSTFGLTYIAGPMTLVGPPTLPADWMVELNTKAKAIVDRYPTPVAAVVALSASEPGPTAERAKVTILGPGQRRGVWHAEGTDHDYTWDAMDNRWLVSWHHGDWRNSVARADNLHLHHVSFRATEFVRIA